MNTLRMGSGVLCGAQRRNAVALPALDQLTTIESPWTEIAVVGSGRVAGPFATEPSRSNGVVDVLSATRFAV
jgi:hypothetical protein